MNSIVMNILFINQLGLYLLLVDHFLLHLLFALILLLYLALSHITLFLPLSKPYHIVYH